MTPPPDPSNFTDQSVFQAIPGNIALLLPNAPIFTIIAATEGYCEASGKRKEELIGKGIFEAFPNPPDDPDLISEKRLRASLEHTLTLKEPHRLPLHRYDITNERGFFSERYWSTVNKPVLNAAGEVIYILHYAEDVTDQIVAEQRAEQLTNVQTQHQELQTAYNKLQESEEKYRTLFNSIDQGFCVLEILFDEDNTPIDYRFLELNPVFVEQTGLKDAKGKRIKEVIPNHEPHWLKIYGKVVQTGEAIRIVRRSEPLNRWFDVYAFRIGDPQEQKVAVLFSDITKNKTAELRMIEKDRNMRNIIYNAPVAIIIFRGEDMVIDTINERMLKLIGKTSEVIGKPLLNVLPELKDQPINDILYNVYKTGKPDYGNEWMVSLLRDGVPEDRYFNFAFTPIREHGQVVGVMDVVTEVTERVKARKEIEKKSQELMLAIDVADLGTFRVDLLQDQATYSPRIMEWFGITEQGLSIRTLLTYIHPDDQQQCIAAIENASKPESNGRIDITYKVVQSSQGTVRHLRSFNKVYLNEEGKAYEMVGVIQDVTEEKKAEALLEQRVKERTRELEMSNKELEQFTYVSSHDLQEPLRKIILFTDMVKPEAATKLSEASQNRLDRVTLAARRMSAALRDVLDYASLNKKEQYMQVDLDEVLTALQTDLELVIAEKGAQIHADELPTINAVPQQMHQLFFNLVNNALKFSKPGVLPVINITCRLLSAEELEAHAELDQNKRHYQIDVQDNGIGFDQDVADKIFVMFQRLHSKDAYEGTGIGLSLCKKVVQSHGGKIWAEGREGKGATFRIVLPEA